jgi:tetratricopeptide (TPR) repeat protein
MRAALAMMGVSNVLSTMKRAREALEVQERAVEILRAQVGPSHDMLASNLGNLSARLRAVGRHAEARDVAQEAIAAAARSGREVLPSYGYHYRELSAANRELGELEQALENAQRVAEIWSGTLGPRHPKVAWGHAAIGEARLARSELPEALLAFERAIELFDPDVDDPRTLAGMEFGLARAALPSDRVHAEKSAREALRIYRSLTYADEETRNVETWLETSGLESASSG